MGTHWGTGADHRPAPIESLTPHLLWVFESTCKSINNVFFIKEPLKQYYKLRVLETVIYVPITLTTLKST